MTHQTRLIYHPEPGTPPPPPNEIGGKAHNLARLAALGVETPRWIALTAAAFHATLPEDTPWPQTAAETAARQQAIRTQELPAPLRDAILAALAAAGLQDVPLAVRSSAVVEDTAAASFAGQFDSLLGVRSDETGALWDAIRRVWSSALSAHAAAYAHPGRGGEQRERGREGEREGTTWERSIQTSECPNARMPAPSLPLSLSPSLPHPQMAVILQEMADAAVSGVAFTADPLSGARDTVVINAVYGLGEALVSGALDADTYWLSFPSEQSLPEPDRMLDAGCSMLDVDPSSPTPPPSVGRASSIEHPASSIALEHRASSVEHRCSIARKERTLRRDPAGGTHWEPVPAALQEEPALTDAEMWQIGAVARRLAEGMGGPQDVEWALVAGEGPERRLVILQSRPITALPAAPTARGERRLWDNSNIIESYGGVTTPLTFSFARSVYEDVYRQFCRLLGVSESLLDEHRLVFAHMLGFIQGRVYYNLLNWYRALALLPGYSLNRAFMERMMGVRQKLADPPPAPYVAGRWEDALRLARMAGRLLREHRRLPREVAAFHARVEAALAPLAPEDLTTWPSDELAALYRRLEAELLRQWRPPLVNDFLAMVAFGILGRLVEKWLPEAPPTLLNDLLCGEGGIISTEPAHRIMSLARQVTAAPALTELFAAEPDDAALWRRIASAPEHQPFHAELRAYLDRFGDRCAHELKLETITLTEQPDVLIRTIREYARAGRLDAEAARERELRVRTDAEALVLSRLNGFRRRCFLVVLRQTRHRVRDRENLRFERTRVFGLARRIFLALGAHLAASGRLAAPRDIFYLTKEEIFSHLDGTGVTTDLAALAALRRAEFAQYERASAPPDRFETFGPPCDKRERGREGERERGTRESNARTPERLNAQAPSPSLPLSLSPSLPLRGTGCCPGIVKAPVRVVRDPHQARDLAGHILVAERTDPGWTLLFPIAQGLLVQRGSLLSHSAIVAREMGLPCIVGIAELLETLADGDWVEMDGTTGAVRVMGIRET